MKQINGTEFDVTGITEPSSWEMLERFKSVTLSVNTSRQNSKQQDLLQDPRSQDPRSQDPRSQDSRSTIEISTNYVQDGTGTTPILLIHGFDSSLLEFRRLLPKLVPHQCVYAVDLLGFGFTQRCRDLPICTQTIQAHLYAFWESVIQKPMVLVGASMGGAAAIDFALAFPDLVERLVLIDTAGWQAGGSMGRFLIPLLGYLATSFLKNSQVRQQISEKAYFDPKFASEDALACAGLHLQCDRWRESLISFTRNQGYGSYRSQLPTLEMSTLLLWGRADRILGVKDVTPLSRAIPNCQLEWIEDCGHVPHLEKSGETVKLILNSLEVLADFSYPMS